jgi:hypothetical protein
MTTCADLIDESRRYLFSGQRELMNSLVNPQINTDTTFTFTYDVGSIREGSYLAIDLEIVYVWTVSAQNKTAVVQRGMLGSLPASHAAGSLVYVNSKFPAFSIFQAMNNDLDDLSAPNNGLYRVTSTQVTYNPAVQGYDLGVTTDLIDVLSVRCQIPGPSKDWVPLNGFRVDHTANTTDFASGFSLTLFEGGSPGLPIRVTYSAPFTRFAALSDNFTVCGLPASAQDLPAMGAALRLVGFREIKRNFDESQGDTRRASEVPPNAQLAGYQALARERQRRINAEAGKLGSTYPNKRKGINL